MQVGGHSGFMQIEKGISYRKVLDGVKLEQKGGEEGISVDRQPCPSDWNPHRVKKASHGAQLSAECWSSRQVRRHLLGADRWENSPEWDVRTQEGKESSHLETTVEPK